MEIILHYLNSFNVIGLSFDMKKLNQV